MITEALILVITILVVWSIMRHVFRVSTLPPGPRGLPILGYLPWLDPEHPYRTLTQLAAKYGPVYSLRMGSLDCVVVSDNNIIKELLSKEEVAGRPPLFMFAKIMEGRGIIFSESQTWKEQRKFAGLAMKRVGLVGQGLDSWLSRTVKEMVELLLDTSDQYIDPQDTIVHVVGNMMNQAIFSKRYSKDDPTWKYLQMISKEGAHRFGTLAPVNFLPWLRFLPSVQKNISWIK